MMSILKSMFKNSCFSFNKYIWSLIIIYTVFFGYSVFIMNDVNQSVLSAIGCAHSFGCDQASMLDSMLKMLELKTLYNQMAAYHSSYYGWTYFFISFWFLLPVKLITWLMGIPPYLPIFIGLKVLNVIYGVLAGISFYFLMTRFTNKFCALLFSLILILASPLTHYIYTFHPEAIGVFFLNISCIYLVDLLRQQSNQNVLPWYSIILISLTLATLSKPMFFLITAPLYLVLGAIYIKKSEQIVSVFIRSSEFKKMLGRSIYFPVIIFLLINPFFFLNLKRSIYLQLENIFAHRYSSLTMHTWQESLMTWMSAISSDLFLLIGIISTNLVLLYLCLDKRLDRFLRHVFLFIQLAVVFNIVFIFFNMRLIIRSTYLVQVLPFLLINVFLVISTLVKIFAPSEKIRGIFLVIVSVMLAYGSLKSNLGTIRSFYDYQHISSYRVFLYIRHNVPDGVIIIHDHLVGIPDEKKSYHYWQHSENTLKALGADYVIFYPELKFNNIYHEQTVVLKEIIRTQRYKKIKTIDNIEIWQKNPN